MSPEAPTASESQDLNLFAKLKIRFAISGENTSTEASLDVRMVMLLGIIKVWIFYIPEESL